MDGHDVDVEICPAHRRIRADAKLGAAGRFAARKSIQSDMSRPRLERHHVHNAVSNPARLLARIEFAEALTACGETPPASINSHSLSDLLSTVSSFPTTRYVAPIGASPSASVEDAFTTTSLPDIEEPHSSTYCDSTVSSPSPLWSCRRAHLLAVSRSIGAHYHLDATPSNLRCSQAKPIAESSLSSHACINILDEIVKCRHAEYFAQTQGGNRILSRLGMVENENRLGD
eukprot:scaffold23197_cov36-Tisochrysis_lutea.AAC.2